MYRLMETYICQWIRREIYLPKSFSILIKIKIYVSPNSYSCVLYMCKILIIILSIIQVNIKIKLFTTYEMYFALLAFSKLYFSGDGGRTMSLLLDSK